MNSNQQQNVDAVMAIVGENLDRSRVWEALQMPGSNVRHIDGRFLEKGNQGLALVGDSVAKTVVAVEGYNAGDSRSAINAALSNALSNENFHRICHQTGLEKLINRNPSHVGSLGTRTTSATVEGVIGAAYFTGGLDMAERVMRALGILE